MIVANDAVATIGSAFSTAVILRPDVPPEALPELPKGEVAAAVLDRLVPILARWSNEDNGR